jgi:hypothetical protein
VAAEWWAQFHEGALGGGKPELRTETPMRGLVIVAAGDGWSRYEVRDDRPVSIHPDGRNVWAVIWRGNRPGDGA